MAKLGRVLTVGQGKGGVGKTSFVCNVGGLAAAAGVRSLIVDLDPQGNASRDLGLERSTGQEFLNALISGARPPIVESVRPGLDVVQGGPMLDDLVGLAFSRMNRGEGIGEMLSKTLSLVADDYDLIILDTPPGDKFIVDAAFSIATVVVIPTRSDDASLDGVERVAQRFVAAKERNTDLRLGGVVLFDVGSRSLSIEREVREILSGMLGDVAPVFKARIRHLESASKLTRRKGLLVHELEEQTVEMQKARFEALKRGETPSSSASVSSVAGLADDWEKLAHEVLERIAALELEGVKA